MEREGNPNAEAIVEVVFGKAVNAEAGDGKKD